MPGGLDLRAARLIAAAARILKMCLEKRVVAAATASPADVQAKVAAGYRMVSVGWDYALL